MYFDISLTVQYLLIAANETQFGDGSKSAIRSGICRFRR